MEELMHLEQHRVTGFRTLTGGEIIEMEIDAHRQMLAYARGKGWTKEEISRLERNKLSWEEDRKKYSNQENKESQTNSISKKIAFQNKKLDDALKKLDIRALKYLEGYKRIKVDTTLSKIDIEPKELILSEKIGGIMGENIIHPKQRNYFTIDALSETSVTPLSYKRVEIPKRNQISELINEAYTKARNNNIKAQNNIPWDKNINFEKWDNITLHVEYPYSDCSTEWLQKSFWPQFTKNKQRPFKNDGTISKIYIHLNEGSVVELNVSNLPW
jgi:hypothetical protein